MRILWRPYGLLLPLSWLLLYYNTFSWQHFPSWSALQKALYATASPVEFQRQLWYHTGISKEKAEQRLENVTKGSFLVGESKSKPGCFSLSLKHPGGITHFAIEKKVSGLYEVPGTHKCFTSLPELIEYFKCHPISEDPNHQLISPCCEALHVDKCKRNLDSFQQDTSRWRVNTTVRKMMSASLVNMNCCDRCHTHPLVSKWSTLIFRPNWMILVWICLSVCVCGCMLVTFWTVSHLTFVLYIVASLQPKIDVVSGVSTRVFMQGCRALQDTRCDLYSYLPSTLLKLPSIFHLHISSTSLCHSTIHTHRSETGHTGKGPRNGYRMYHKECYRTYPCQSHCWGWTSSTHWSTKARCVDCGIGYTNTELNAWYTDASFNAHDRQYTPLLSI